jgi:hypothetical protein
MKIKENRLGSVVEVRQVNGLNGKDIIEGGQEMYSEEEITRGARLCIIYLHTQVVEI